jgi:hypothetical protein
VITSKKSASLRTVSKAAGMGETGEAAVDWMSAVTMAMSSFVAGSRRRVVGAFGAEVQAGARLAVFQRDGGEAEVGVDVAAGVEDVFDHALDAARTDTVERGAEVAAGVFDAVTGGAVLGEERRTACGVGLGGSDRGGAGEDESVEAGVFGGEIFDEGGGALAEVHRGVWRGHRRRSDGGAGRRGRDRR